MPQLAQKALRRRCKFLNLKKTKKHCKGDATASICKTIRCTDIANATICCTSVANAANPMHKHCKLAAQVQVLEMFPKLRKLWNVHTHLCNAKKTGDSAQARTQEKVTKCHQQNKMQTEEHRLSINTETQEHLRRLQKTSSVALHPKHVQNGRPKNVKKHKNHKIITH